MNRRSFITLMIHWLVLMPALVKAGGRGEQTPLNPKGVIEYLEGEVLVNGAQAEIGQEITMGATVQTGEDSFCEIVFAGKNIFRIQEQSTASLEIDEIQGSITLKQGAMAAVFTKLQTLSASGGTFRVQTPTAVAGVRGTAFFIKVEDADSTYICTCNGVLGIEDAEQGNRRTVKSEHHRAYRFSRGTGGIRMRRAPRLYHNNATMNVLAAKIRVRIPWGPGKNEDKNNGY